jgi:hypothetical protein
MSEMRRILDQIVVARRYTLGLLEDIAPSDWFRTPSEGVTHVAWQVGHLAFAQYRLALVRLRGQRPDDEALLPAAFTALFGRESVPDPDPARYPDPAEIRAVFDRVHDALLRELPEIPDTDLDHPLEPPHALAKTKREVLLWCSHHEMIHAGQIGLLRRLLGRSPRW